MFPVLPRLFPIRLGLTAQLGAARSCLHTWAAAGQLLPHYADSARRDVLCLLLVVQANGVAPKARGVLGSFVSSLALRVVGSAALTAEDLSPALADMKVCVC